MKKQEDQLREKKFFDKLVKTTGGVWWGHATAAGIGRMRRRARLAAQKLTRFRDPVVLELGCGTGTLSKFILEELPLLRLTACDISPECVQIANDRYGVFKNARFEVADATSTRYASDTFDAVIGNSILHHLPIELSLRECFRLLKTDGIILFSEPNMMNPQIAIEKNSSFIGRILQNTENETAFFRWSLAKTLQRFGFQDVSVQPFDFLHPIVPSSLIGVIDSIGRVFEKIPLLREVAGSLFIYACKSDADKTVRASEK